MKIAALGDSFTHGDELTDTRDAWPSVLSNMLSVPVDNFGKPANNNTAMVRTVIENISQYDAFIIAWSHFARIETADTFGVYSLWPGANSNQFSHPDVEHRKDNVEYFTMHNADEYLYTQYLINVILLQNLFTSHNKKYILLNAFGNNKMHDQLKHIPAVAYLESQISVAEFLGWPSETMMEWAYGMLKGPHGHFLKEGHQCVAQKIYEHTRLLGWIP